MRWSKPWVARPPKRSSNLAHPSDPARSTSVDFGKRCKALGVRPSMGRVGGAFDTAMTKRLFCKHGVRAH